MADDDFTRQVGEKLAELTSEKPTVSEQELVSALGITDPEQVPKVEEALDELATASVAVQIGHNATDGRMWRHSGMTTEDAEAALEAERAAGELEARRLAREEDEAVAARADEIERERGEGDDDDDDEPARQPARRASRDAQAERVELPMSVVGVLSPEAVAEIVSAGVAAAKETGAGFEFVVTP